VTVFLRVPERKVPKKINWFITIEIKILRKLKGKRLLKVRKCVLSSVKIFFLFWMQVQVLLLLFVNFGDLGSIPSLGQNMWVTVA